MNPIITVIIAVAACLLGGIVGYTYRKSYTEKKIDRTEEYAKRLYDDAVRKATTRRKKCSRPRRRS